MEPWLGITLIALAVAAGIFLFAFVVALLFTGGDFKYSAKVAGGTSLILVGGYLIAGVVIFAAYTISNGTAW